MRRKTDEIDVQTAAYLASQGFTQEGIGKALNLSQSVISRLLKRAKTERWLEEYTPRFATEKISPERMAAIEQRVSPRQLQIQLHELARRNGTRAGPSIRVFPSAGQGTTQDAWTFRLQWFGKAIAGHIQALLLRSTVTGIAWGGTLANVVRGLSELCLPPPWKGHPIQFVPLCGEPLGNAVTQFSASSLAAQLDEIVNGSMRHSLSLAVVPALIPEEFGPDEVVTIRRLIGYVQAYSEIFRQDDQGRKQHTSWINRIDTVLTSVGSAEHSLAFGSDEFVSTGGINREQLRELIIGDICGVLLPRPRLSAAGLAEVAKIQERWTGIRQQHLHQYAESASKKGNDTVGIIVVAIGENKAEIVYESVKRGLVNQLVIDQDLATKLEELVTSR